MDAAAWDVYKLPWPGEHRSRRGKVHPALGGYYPPEEEAGTGPITGKVQQSGPFWSRGLLVFKVSWISLSTCLPLKLYCRSLHITKKHNLTRSLVIPKCISSYCNPSISTGHGCVVAAGADLSSSRQCIRHVSEATFCSALHCSHSMLTEDTSSCAEQAESRRKSDTAKEKKRCFTFIRTQNDAKWSKLGHLSTSRNHGRQIIPETLLVRYEAVRRME